ncbi:hypothetical protein LBMAG56_43940 [Verrucomicrobiota bacterium]|nr:hypothetical protein LBMAG56_43940 [Verrucomicrobiota bacterium]
MKQPTQKNSAGLTLTELVIVIAVVGLLVAMLLPALNKQKAVSGRIPCVNNQKRIGVAFRVFAEDNNAQYPLQITNLSYVVAGRIDPADFTGRILSTNQPYIVEGVAIGGQVNSASAAAWQVAQALWNELETPKMLLCPQDRERATPAKLRVTDFNGLAGETNAMSTPSLGHVSNQNRAISYAFGVAADESRPLGVLTVDRNLNNVGMAGATIAWNVALSNTRAVMNDKPGPTQVVFVTRTPIHGTNGNLAYADSSVQQATATVLQTAFHNAATSYGTITNQNEILFP